MLFITPTSNARSAKEYFSRALDAPDYYISDAQERPGVWHGAGAPLLGLSGTVSKDDFFALSDNRHPQTGEALTPRTKAGRRVFYDFTFDAPKSVSLAFELCGDDRILDAFRTAVSETMGEMEADMHARVRTGGADGDRRTANMVWAEFIHRTARPVDGITDPQLHCHAVAFNTTFDPIEGRWKAAQFGNLVRDKLYYQSAFHSRLAGYLAELGYGIERDGTSFALKGIDRSTAQKFSRRSAVIDDEAERLGIHDAHHKGELGRRTREAKQDGMSMDELRAAWDARLTEDERATLTLSNLCQNETACTEEAAQQAIDHAVSHCFERASVIADKRLVAEALMQSVGKATVQDVWHAAHHANLIGKDVNGQHWVTTRAVYREEMAMVAFARDGRGQYRKLGGAQPVELDPMLSEEQRQAALTLLNSRDTVVGLKGGAGTGKTRMMQATVAAIERTGKQVFAFAPSAKASRGVLRAEGFATADTVEKLLTDQELQSKVKGQVLWIDEAGLLSVPDLKRLFDVAKQQQSRVVLSGDSAQHNAVMRGDALRLLEVEAGMTFAQLRTIRRQTQEDYRAAVHDLAQGDVRLQDGRTGIESGLDRLDRMGAIVEVDDDARHALLAADYAKATAAVDKDGKHKTALVVSPTHREGEQVADAIRSELKHAGRITGMERTFVSLRALNLTEAQRRQADNYRSGMVVRFHQNAKGFARGERVTVTGHDGTRVQACRSDGSVVSLPLHEAQKFQVYQEDHLTLAQGDRLRITLNGFTQASTKAGTPSKSRLDNGDVFDVAGFTRSGDIALSNGLVVPKDYGGIAQGYVVTSHASQGATVDKVLIALGSESLAAANRQQFYVSASRGREGIAIYTDDKAAMRDAVRGDAARLTATELLHEAKAAPRAQPSKAAYLVGLQRIRRVYDAIRERVGSIGSLWRDREVLLHGL